MATLNLILDTRRARKDGTYPIIFRVRVKNKYFDIASGITLQPDQFDIKTSSVKDDLLLNEQLLKMKMHYISKLREYISDNIDYTDLKEIKNHLCGKEASSYTLRSFWEQIIDEMKSSNRHGNARVYSMTLSVISKETDLDIPVKSFNYQKLIALEKNLYSRGMSCNGISVYMKTLRAICNKAINYDIVDYQWYPFRKYRLKTEKTIPRTISTKEMTSYFHLALPPNHPYYKTWLIGKLIFMLRGINIKDLLLLSSDNVKNGRIIY